MFTSTKVEPKKSISSKHLPVTNTDKPLPKGSAATVKPPPSKITKNNMAPPLRRSGSAKSISLTANKTTKVDRANSCLIATSRGDASEVTKENSTTATSNGNGDLIAEKTVTVVDSKLNLEKGANEFENVLESSTRAGGDGTTHDQECEALKNTIEEPTAKENDVPVIDCHQTIDESIDTRTTECVTALDETDNACVESVVPDCSVEEEPSNDAGSDTTVKDEQTINDDEPINTSDEVENTESDKEVDTTVVKLTAASEIDDSDVKVTTATEVDAAVRAENEIKPTNVDSNANVILDNNNNNLVCVCANCECVGKQNVMMLSKIEGNVDSKVGADSKTITKDVEKSAEVSKHAIRHQVWSRLEDQNLVVFPRPCYNRIPNFKGAPIAAEKLGKLESFKKSKTIRVNQDKAQEMVRYHVLTSGKQLLVPVSRLHDGVLKVVNPPENLSSKGMQLACQRYGMNKWSNVIPIDNISIDMVVIGSVAADKKGHRIGKGEGFADLEFAMLVEMNAINENTTIVTTVHDEQIFDELPEQLFSEFDVPVDIIVTPTQVYEVSERLTRPSKIYWNLISNRRIREIPTLQKLRENSLNDGEECILKDTDSVTEEQPPYASNYRRRRRISRYARSTGDPMLDIILSPPSGRRRSTSSIYMNQPRDSRMKFPPTPYFRRGSEDFNDPRKRRSMSHADFQTSDNILQHDFRSRRPQPSINNHNHNNGRQRSVSRRRLSASSKGEHDSTRMPRNNRYTSSKSVEVQTVDGRMISRGIRHRYRKRKQSENEYSVRIKNIATDVRVRDLKNALASLDVKAKIIIWKKNLAILHLTTGKETVLNTLQKLPLLPKGKKSLVTEILPKLGTPKVNVNKEKEDSAV